MADSSLLVFVHDALRSGASRADIERVSLEAGWTREQVASALAVYAAVEFPIPVPRPKRQLSARDAFFYLVLFAMLYVSAYNFGKLLFQFVNLAFPDPLSAGRSPMIAYDRVIGEKIRWATSSLIVAFPLFVHHQSVAG